MSKLELIKEEVGDIVMYYVMLDNGSIGRFGDEATARVVYERVKKEEQGKPTIKREVIESLEL